MDSSDMDTTVNNNIKGGASVDSGAAIMDSEGPDPELPAAPEPVPGTAPSRFTTSSTYSATSDYEKTRNRLDTLCVVGYCIGLITFVCLFHVKGFPYIPYPVIGNLQDVDPTLLVADLWEDGTILVLVTWGLRYIRKMGMLVVDQFFFRAHLSETVNSDEVSGRLDHSPAFAPTFPATLTDPSLVLCYAVPIILYHGIFGAWVGLAANYNLTYQISDIEWVIAGLVFFLGGELIVVGRTVWAARQARHSTDPVFVGRAIMPVVEVAEVMSCVGYAFLTLTLPACLMAFVRFIIAILAAALRKVHGAAF